MRRTVSLHLQQQQQQHDLVITEEGVNNRSAKFQDSMCNNYLLSAAGRPVAAA
jgi:hypothetical protein